MGSGLPKAGVEYTAAGFKQYIKDLEAARKKQKEVFDTTLKGTQLSFNQVNKAAKDYERQLKKTEKQQKDFGGTLKTFGAVAIAAVTGEVARFVFESAKLAAQFDTQRAGLQNLAASFGQSGNEIQRAIVAASKGTLSGLQAMGAANEALLLGVAKTPEEFTKFTKAALILGRTVGLTASQSITRFTTALGRESLLRLDDFGAKASEVNEEIIKLAQSELGKLPEQLSKAEKSVIFIEAALNVTGANVAKIGEEASGAIESFERLTAASEDIRITIGEAFRPLLGGELTDALKSGQEAVAILTGAFAVFGSLISQSLDQAQLRVLQLKASILFLTQGASEEFKKLTQEIRNSGIQAKTFGETFDEAVKVGSERFKDVARTIDGISFPEDEIKGLTSAFQNQEAAIEADTQALINFNQIAKQTEQLAISLARAQEDAQRDASRDIAKLQDKQTQDRDKLLKKQIRQLDDLRRSESKSIQDIAKTREQAALKRLQQQRKLQQQLKQEQERFNLSLIQSDRRFQLAETRLRAEGDILGIQQLREDNELRKQEEQEGFSLSQSQTRDSAKTEAQEQAENLELQINALKQNLEDQRAELLRNFDQQLIQQQEAQAIQRSELQRDLGEKEQDRLISQQRQLQDLGRSFADQEGITAEGTQAIAGQLQNVFGQAGVADNIITGFTARTESEFTQLFQNIQQIVGGASLPIGGGTSISSGSLEGLPRFQEGGIVGGPGPIGSPQVIQAHKGETVLPTHQQSFTMAAPVIPAQVLSVEMSGGFNISGGEQAGEEMVKTAIDEMTDTLEIAVRRLARRSG